MGAALDPSPEPRGDPMLSFSSAPAAQSAIAACAVTGAASILVLSFKSLGGYGWAEGIFTWCLHPTLLLLATLVVLPYGMLIYRLQPDGARAAARARHGAAQLAGLASALGGYAAAWALLELKGHAHLPALHKPLSKQLHIYGGLAALALLLWQAARGAAMAAAPEPVKGARAAHSAWGFRVWAALLFVSWLGLEMPLFEKAGANAVAPVLFALLSGGFGGSAFLMARALA